MLYPNNAVCRNFYEELLRWPNRYREYFAVVAPGEASHTARLADVTRARECEWPIGEMSSEDRRWVCQVMRDALELKGLVKGGALVRPVLKGDSTDMKSPLRAFTYGLLRRQVHCVASGN